MSDLRKRRNEDQSSNLIEKESKHPKISRYKIFLQYPFIIGAIIFSIISLFIIINSLKSYFINDYLSDEKYYPSEIYNLFRKYDRDDNNYLSIDEFEALAFYFNNKKFSTDYIQPILNSDQVLTINAFFEPLNFTTLSQNARYSYFINLDEVQSLKLWKQPFIPRLNFAARHFQSFLPKTIEIGKPYWIIQSKQQHRFEHLSSNRYYPPDISNEHIIFHRLLSMFHSRPFILSRFPPQGTVAVVRARHGAFLDIYFRMHAEFQLNTPPYHPFWYTPAQFQGRLIIRDDASEITYFNMYVPNEKRLNVDMEWFVDRGGPSASMEVDIGHMSQMELRSAAPSIKVNETGMTPEHFISTMNDKLYENLLKSFSWMGENILNEKEVFDLLERKFYPFKEIPYYEYRRTLRETVLESSAVQHLLREHFVSTWTLVVDLKAIISNQSNDTIKDSQRAKQAVDSYSFPVQSMIQQIDGTVISKVNANDLLNVDSTSEQFLNM
ncbi:unnamed protein product [Adineta steineri]|uniref:EF-hand domain-containing protein n=1 Tax=Adineta steineri TaxID=433720 RepID=A0A813S6X4_9BILA|nr:unnamed protein product [Adineta steineri]